MATQTPTLTDAVHNIRHKMPKQILLTDARRKVLRGEHDGAESTIRTQQSRIRTRSKMALDELIEVAESPYVDTKDVFDPETVGDLLYALLLPDAPVLPDEEASEEHREYQQDLYVEIDRVLRLYQEGRR